MYATPNETYYIKTIAGKEGASFKVNVPALEAQFGQSRGVVVSKKGDLYLSSASHHVVLKVQFNRPVGTSNVTIIAGTGQKGTGGDNIPGTESPLGAPTALSLIEDELTGDVLAILIADMNNHRIRQLNMTTMLIHTIAGTGNNTFSGDGGLGLNVTFNSPHQAYYDKATRDLLIVDISNHRIRRMFAHNGTVTTVAGGNPCSQTVNKGDGGQATAACLNSPMSVCVNATGDWFIADNNHNLIRKVDPNGIITSVTSNGTSTIDGPASNVKVNYPWSIGLTPSGELLVGENGGGVVRKKYSDGVMKTIAGGGSVTNGEEILATQVVIKPTFVGHTHRGILIADQSGRIMQLYSTCYGVIGYDPSACSGHGMCVELDQCSCDDGWLGSDCSIPHCFGIMSNDTSVCSRHGTCIGFNQCQCDRGWFGTDCSITHCFGVSSNLPDRVCSGRGECVRPNKCHCERGHRGHKCHKPYQER